MVAPSEPALGSTAIKRDGIRVNAKKFMQSRYAEEGCADKVSSLLDCLKRTDFDESPGQCAAQYSALKDCHRQAANARALRGTHAPTINYHLARMARLMRKRG